ncbi:MAG: sigma-70 family RNA polymerase sigma factor, partial [Candidatus Aminicenantes bacterium]|nr:sigma-70 family RNA polymerase sigma factor [Candidatus Aminicenantes bacterium]
IESSIGNDTPEINIQLKEDKANLRECINSLSERLRSVFVLREYGGNSCEEISDILNIQLGTVYSRLNRAKNKVTKLMGDINGQS